MTIVDPCVHCPHKKITKKVEDRNLHADMLAILDGIIENQRKIRGLKENYGIDVTGENPYRLVDAPAPDCTGLWFHHSSQLADRLAMVVYVSFVEHSQSGGTSLWVSRSRPAGTIGEVWIRRAEACGGWTGPIPEPGARP